MSLKNSLTVQPGGKLIGKVSPPGDKSVSHRAVMLGALADGSAAVQNCLMSDDVLATIEACRNLGVRIDCGSGDSLEIHGVGVDGLKQPAAPLDLGNSGTSMRLLSGLLAGAGISATLTGDASLRRRPMQRIAEPLERMGARVSMSADGTAPLVIAAPQPLQAIDYVLPIASAQVKSAVLLAGLFARGMTKVSEPAPTRDHTERMLRAFGVDLDAGSEWIGIQGGQRLTPVDISVPADLSSAAFFIIGAAIAADSNVVIPAVGVNPTRTGVIDIMQAMGARITVSDPRSVELEPIGDLRISGSDLRGIKIPAALIPLAIDEFPAVLIAAACARGQTVLRGAAELRHKESDRIAVMADGLQRLGIAVEIFADGIAVEGGELTGGEIDAHGDHRVAMAFAVAALRARDPIVIHNAAGIASSYPDFLTAARGAGLRVI